MCEIDTVLLYHLIKRLSSNLGAFMGNKIKYYVHQVLSSLIILLTYGAVLQTFLIEYGLSEQQVNVYSSVMQIFQVATILLFSKVADRTRNIIKMSALMRLFEIPMIAMLLVLCFFTEINIVWVLVIIFALGLLYNFSMGSRSVIDYKLPYNIIDIRDYGKVTAFGGILIGIFSVVFSLALSLFQSKTEYFFSMKVVFLVSAVMIFAFVAATALMKQTYKMPPLEKKQKTNIFKYKPYTHLIIPNLARGFCSGVIGLAVTIGYFTGVIDKTSSSYIVIITSAVTILGCLAYSFISKRVNDAYLHLTLGIATAVLLPLLCLGGTVFFLVAYSIIFFVKIIVDYSVPVTITKIIDYKIAGQYSAWRMLLHTLGASLSGFVCIPLFNLIGVMPTMILTGLLQLVCGVGYFIYLRKNPIGKIVQAVSQ